MHAPSHRRMVTKLSYCDSKMTEFEVLVLLLPMNE